MEEKLIEAVRVRKVLYDTCDVDYMKAKLKFRLWGEIAKEIGLESGSEAKNKWEKLRHSLRDALRRQKNYIKSEAQVFPSKPWRFQKQMEFLQPFMEKKRKEFNVNDESDEKFSTTQNSENLQCEDTEAEGVWETATKPREDEGAILETVTNLSETLKRKVDESPCYLTTGSSTENITRPQKRINKKTNVCSLLKQSLKNKEERAVLLDKTQTPNDALYYFFMSMYETTTKMPPSLQYVVKNHIYKAVTDMEAILLNIPQTQYSIQNHYDHDYYNSSLSVTPRSSQSENITDISFPNTEDTEHIKMEEDTLVNSNNQFSTN